MHQHRNRRTPVKEIFTSENGAIDLASIMVSIIVIGMIGGVIAATVFAVIPWSQDNAAKQQLDSVVAAESAYMGLSSTNPPSLPAGLAGNSYGSSAELEAAGLLKTGPKYCVSTTNTGPKSYEAFSQSSSGKIWSATDTATKPVIFTGTLPTDCQFITEGVPAASSPSASPSAPPVEAYVDPTPTKTILTYKCDTTSAGAIPMITGLTGSETWNGGVPTNYSNAASANQRTLAAGVDYTVVFDGTYSAFSSSVATSSGIANCLRSVDHWGSQTGVTNATNAFYNARNLTKVPAHIPPTITLTGYMFYFADNMNDPNVSKWNVSNVTNMSYMFQRAFTFNQPLDKWDVSKVTTMHSMFYSAIAFNQDINSWNVSNVTNMGYLFYNALSFNQPLNNWNTANVTFMHYMFDSANKFNQSINDWNVSNVSLMMYMFRNASAFDQPLDKWATSQVTNMSYMFEGALVFNQPISSWNVSKVTNMSYMFNNARAFNQPINSWIVSNVTTTTYMFSNASAFNQSLNSWNVAKVADMKYMFYNAPSFNQNISNWTTTALTTANGTYFAPSTFTTSYLPPKTSKY